MTLPTLKKLDVANKTVLVRTGFDLPIENGKVADDFRILRAMETLNYLAAQRAKVVILTHLGRPKGWDESLSLKPVAESLSRIWNRKLIIIGAKTKKLPEYDIPHLYFFEHNILESDIMPLVSQMRPGDAAILENLRFYEGEERADQNFAKKLAELGQVYVNEAFSNSHREHASMILLPKLLPSAAGIDLIKDLEILQKTANYPKRPLVLLLGGTKVVDRLPILEKLLKKSDYALFGGGLANLFLKILGFEVGQNQTWASRDETLAKSLLRDYKDKIKLPSDVVVSRTGYTLAQAMSLEQIRPAHIVADIGPKTILDYSQYIKQAQTLVFSGPLGHFEVKPFSHGTLALVRLIAGRSRSLSFGFAGGGETLEIIARAGVVGLFDHVSTGGTSMLRVLAGFDLAALTALQSE
ncbi:MAG: phosphoglycerate kinase [bacterium]|nr:phosphoglycerate kinase [bacterium]